MLKPSVLLKSCMVLSCCSFRLSAFTQCRLNAFFLVHNSTSQSQGCSCCSTRFHTDSNQSEHFLVRLVMNHNPSKPHIRTPVGIGAGLSLESLQARSAMKGYFLTGRSTETRTKHLMCTKTESQGKKNANKTDTGTKTQLKITCSSGDC